MSELVLRDKIERLREAIAELPQDAFESIVCHGGGMFARTIKLKAGQVLVGKIHRCEHLNIMSSGDITVTTEEGTKRLEGFNIMASKPGSRRVGVVHADTVWTTILKTDETELDAVEKKYFVRAHEELENTSWPSLK